MMLDWMFANRMEDGKTAYPRCLYVLKQAEIVFYEGDFNGRILFKYRLEDLRSSILKKVLIRYWEWKPV
ncbi:hypothetical protein [Tenacibaculum maritimum]|uniref:hypothetical protein n=1 Tax=Tenacibaculum maritimum TaxID=107401 RepID=UPI00132F6EA3|nr:hypothetical protein [Tenacibaculum maritimum]